MSKKIALLLGCLFPVLAACSLQITSDVAKPLNSLSTPVETVKQTRPTIISKTDDDRFECPNVPQRYLMERPILIGGPTTFDMEYTIWCITPLKAGDQLTLHTQALEKTSGNRIVRIAIFFQGKTVYENSGGSASYSISNIPSGRYEVEARAYMICCGEHQYRSWRGYVAVP